MTKFITIIKGKNIQVNTCHTYQKGWLSFIYEMFLQINRKKEHNRKVSKEYKYFAENNLTYENFSFSFKRKGQNAQEKSPIAHLCWKYKLVYLYGEQSGKALEITLRNSTYRNVPHIHKDIPSIVQNSQNKDNAHQ